MDNSNVGVNIAMTFRGPETLDIFKRGVDMLVVENGIREAFELIDRVAPALQASGLAKESPELYQQYDVLLLRARWVALPLLSERDVIDLFEKHLLSAFDLFPKESEHPPFDPWEAIRARLNAEMVIAERNVLKQKIRDALLRNEERLTRTALTLDDVEAPGTLKNWFRDYHRALGTGALDRVEQSKYFVQGKNFTKCTDEEKTRLKAVFHCYERLKIASDTFEGYEGIIGIDDEDVRGVIRDGVFEPIDPKQEERLLAAMEFVHSFGKETSAVAPTPSVPKTPSAPKASSSSIPPPSLTLAPDVAEALRALRTSEAGPFAAAASTGGPASHATERFVSMFAPKPDAPKPSRAERVAIVLTLAEVNAFARVMQDARIRASFEEYLKRQNVSGLLEGFRLSPTAPKYMRRFLQWALQEKTGLAESDAAKIGMRIGQMVKQQGDDRYARIAYYDIKEKKFTWT